MPPSEPVPDISVVIPAYNEALGIAQTLTAVEQILRSEDCSFEIVVVDDGSVDGTFEALQHLAKNYPWLHGIRLSRNFGKEGALLAGLGESRGRAVVTMDADLQHPPEYIPQLIAAWRDGAKVVNAIKANRSADRSLYSWFAKRATGLLSKLAGIPLQYASDFKLLDRVVVDVIAQSLPERERLFRGLAAWVGFKQVDIPFNVAKSIRPKTRWSRWSLIRLTLTALTSFTGAPLQIITLFGVITLVMAVIIGGEALFSRMHHQTVSGYTTVILTLLVLGSFIMISLGIIGYYINKLYKEVKRRPLSVIEARTEQK
ncbi:MAG TPA: glycosyltransferase family 2 protein [Burkholderiales bacterium]|nr:glycosyltransferase family 2 protein [Burkholderiales bacterium]